MQVTSDTLFHFTSSLEKLESILSIKFQLTYCHEKYILDYETQDSYYPMVSFCDIPLSLAKDQIGRYGSYAIGMSKEWGISHKLNPVVYIEKDSLLAKDIQGGIDNSLSTLQSIGKFVENIGYKSKEIAKDLDERAKEYSEDNEPSKLLFSKEIMNISKNYLQASLDAIDDYRDLTKQLVGIVNKNSNLFRYIKNYRGTLIRNGKATENYRFYDEREWRYIPSLGDKRVEDSLTEEKYKKYREANPVKPFIQGINLPFKIDEINYLIVESEKDIPTLINSIKKIFGLSDSPDGIDILTTKILTIEQLNKDF